MSDERKDILPDEGFPGEELLKKYLSNQLPEEERHKLELAMLNDPLLAEAMEGLEAIPPNNIHNAVNRINLDFQKAIAKRKGKKRKRKIAEQPITILAIILILLLCVIAYIVIRKFT
ncbi:MAG: hypothetical protein IT254_00390 [Chitinophagaceae bacterium]|nr:hypothetical protein [Bacteroidota bacterium]MCC6256757.1 hypothetical protein [Chitinophagaceae bacterium]MCW5915794.1 hypothetical protein [Ferruginibacter sp.]